MVNINYKIFKEYKLENFLIDLEKEWNKQDIKFPKQTHTIEKWLVIIMEEIGEVCKEILELNQNDFSFHKLYKELIQSITLLIRFRYTPYRIDFKNQKIIL